MIQKIYPDRKSQGKILPWRASQGNFFYPALVQGKNKSTVMNPTYHLYQLRLASRCEPESACERLT